MAPPNEKQPQDAISKMMTEEWGAGLDRIYYERSTVPPPWGEPAEIKIPLVDMADLQNQITRAIAAARTTILKTNPSEDKENGMYRYTFAVGKNHFDLTDEEPMLPISRVAEIAGIGDISLAVRDEERKFRLKVLDPEEDFLFPGVNVTFYAV